MIVDAARNAPGHLAIPLRSTLVLVEAAPERASWIKHAVHRGGFDCDVAHFVNGPDAIDALIESGDVAKRIHHFLPQLILLSRDLPALDGLQVAKHLHRTHRDDRSPLPPIVMYAPAFDPGDMAQARRYGVSSCIQISTSEARCIEEIQQTLVYWLLLDRFPRPPHFHTRNNSRNRRWHS